MQTEALQQRTLFVLSHAPHSQSLAQDCLDAVMTAALLNQLVSLLFVSDGVYQLAESAWATKIQSLCELAPVELYVAKQDMETRQLGLESLHAGEARQLDKAQLAALFDHHHRVLSF